MDEVTTAQLRSSHKSKENGTGRTASPTEADQSPAPHSSAPSSHSTLAYVFLFLLVDLLGFTVILPLIPSLLEYYDKHDQVFKYVTVLLKG